MTTTFHIKESEIDSKFLKALKSMFKNRTLTMVIEANEIDETDYLLSTEANRNALLESIGQAKNNELISVSLDDLKKLER
jgi:hypothetical protein